MSQFCTKCGSPANGASFCVSCGNDLRSTLNPAQPQTVQAVPNTAPAAPVPATPVAKQGMSTMAKLGIAALVVFVALGAMAVGGAIYVAHRVSQKVHEVKGELLGNSGSSSSASNGSNSINSNSNGSAPSGGSASANSSIGDVCRYLSKQDVGHAIGVEIVATKSEDNGCSYMAVGNSADMTAKHIAAIGASKGADAQGQNMVQNFASTIFKSQQEESHEKGSDENGNVPVLVVSIDDNGAEEQMRLNKGVLGRFPGSQDLPGIGDEAFDASNAIMTIRKGNKLIRIMYTTCPCSTDAVKPLAKKLADAV